MAIIKDLSKGNSLVNQIVSELRDEQIQKDSLRFRRNLERIGEIMAYEISKEMPYEKKEIRTPLGVSKMDLPTKHPVLATIFRAGIPMHQGLLNYFDHSPSAFVSAYRKHNKDGSFDIELEYLACPDLDGEVLVISDPMLATGSSMVVTYKAMLERGSPDNIHIAVVIASKEGLKYTEKHLPPNATIWVAAVDEELTAQSFIVPGLGDAGDLAFGKKD